MMFMMPRLAAMISPGGRPMKSRVQSNRCVNAPEGHDFGGSIGQIRAISSVGAVFKGIFWISDCIFGAKCVRDDLSIRNWGSKW